jgi:hypothetical protein
MASARVAHQVSRLLSCFLVCVLLKVSFVWSRNLALSWAAAADSIFLLSSLDGAGGFVFRNGVSRRISGGCHAHKSVTARHGRLGKGSNAAKDRPAISHSLTDKLYRIR